jgi:hypothetical protein
MAFRVGQKVVCVDAKSGGGGWDKDDHPTEGAVYTIVRSFTWHDNEEVVWLLELRRSSRARRYHGDDVGYGAYRFRPVVDISDLQAIVREQLLGKPRTITPDKFDKPKHKIVAGLQEAIRHARSLRK